MKITPIEIRQKEFERVFRGYEKEAVDAFLKALSQEWERVADENRTLKIQIDLLEKEVNRMKELEGTMFRALKGAEEARSKYAEEGGREVEKRIEEATKEVESRLAQAQTEADEINREAHKKANLLIADAESQAKFVLDEAIAELRGLERDFKAMERYKEQMVNEFKSFTNETLEHINRFEEKLAKNSYQEKMDELKNLNEVYTTATPVANTPALVAENNSAALELTDEELDEDLLNDDEAGELPTLDSILKATTQEEKPATAQPIVSSEAANEINQLLKEVQKQKPKTQEGGSFFDSI